MGDSKIEWPEHLRVRQMPRSPARERRELPPPGRRATFAEALERANAKHGNALRRLAEDD